MTNMTLHTVAIAPELILLTAVIRNVANMFEVSRTQAVQDLLMETLGDVQGLEKITCQPLGIGMALCDCYRPPCVASIKCGSQALSRT
jgi:hypothetical protein